LLAQFLSQFLVSFISTTNDRIFLDLTLDWRVLGFTAFVATLTCVLFGLTPALRATRIEPAAAMKTSGRGLTGGGGKFSLRRALVVVQVALSLVLVASALLFSRSLSKLISVDAGFRPEGILVSSVGFRQLQLPPERRVDFRREMLERIRAIPGVDSASETNIVPLSGSAMGNVVWLDGSDAKGGMDSSFSWVGPSYFKTLGTPLVAGRELTEHDVANTPKVAVVNETFARKLFQDANPVGRRFWIEETPTEPETPYEVVGVVKDTKYGDLREEFSPIAFLALSQQSVPAPSGQFLIRSNLPRGEISAALKRTLAEINPSITVSFIGFKTMIEESLLRERLMATLSGFFGLLALLLASIGLYGILSYGVASRTKEIGIRMALGAQSREVRVSVLRESLVLVLVGVAVGLPIVFFATRFANTLLFGLTPTDPLSLSLAGVLLCAVAMVAGYMPARRATKVDPLVALRYE
jgi:predicted permease